MSILTIRSREGMLLHWHCPLNLLMQARSCRGWGSHLFRRISPEKGEPLTGDYHFYHESLSNSRKNCSLVLLPSQIQVYYQLHLPTPTPPPPPSGKSLQPCSDNVMQIGTPTFDFSNADSPIGPSGSVLLEIQLRG